MAAAWGSSLTGTEQTAIDIAVQVSGQQAVQDLQARLAGVRQEIDFQKAALAGGAQTLQEFQKEIQTLIVQEAKLEEGFKRASNALAGWNKEVRVSQQAGLQLAYALDDIQYGFNGIVNNIPGIVQSLGGSAGLAGGLGAAAVGLNFFNSLLKASGVDLGGIFKEGLKEAARGLDLMRDPLKDAADNLEGLREKIKELEDKPLKLDADYAALRTYSAEVKQAERALRDFENLKNKRSDAEQEAFDAVSKGVSESGGAAALEKALLEIAKRNGTYGAGSEINGQIAQQEEIIRSQAGQVNGFSPSGLVATYRTNAANAEIARLRNALEDEQRAKIARTVGLQGGEGSRLTLRDLVNDPANADIFQRNQIDTDRLGGGIGAADPQNLFQKERNKVAKQEAARAKKEADNIREQEDFLAENERQAEEGRQREANKDAEATAREEAKMRRDTEAAARKNAAAANKAKNDALRAEKEAPGLQEKRDIRDFGREFQGRTGANDGEAMEAGKQINTLVKKGMDPNQAMQATFNQMMRTIIEQQAALEAAAGFFGPYTQQLQMIQGRARQVNRNLRKGAQRGPTLGITF